MTERRLAEVKDYDGMIAALRARMTEIGVTNETMDALTGLQSGYVGKLLGPSQIKRIGPVSMGLLMQGLAIKFVMIEDETLLEEMRERWKMREKAKPLAKPLSSNGSISDFKGFLRRLGRKGGKARIKRMSRGERRRIAARGGKERWRKARRSKRAEIERKNRSPNKPMDKGSALLSG